MYSKNENLSSFQTNKQTFIDITGDRTLPY